MTKVVRSKTNSKLFALRAAQWIGCSGAHQMPDGHWAPCSTMGELQKLSNQAEPKNKTAISNFEENIKKRNKKGKKKVWEKLRETTPLGFDTLLTGGIVSTPIVSIKGVIPGLSPRDDDDDVYTNIESARKRSVKLGCIGVRRLSSQSGKLIWMPCTNNTDYARLAGTTALGRRNQRETTNRSIRTIVRQELSRRKKSLYEELHETKGIGRRIGNNARSLKRRSRNALAKITGELDRNKRRDGNSNGLIFDNTPLEQPAPAKLRQPSVRGLRSGKSGPLSSDEIKKPKIATNVNLSDISKGGPIKASKLLNMVALRNLTREQQATRLGVSKEVIDAMRQPDASIQVYAADRLAVVALEINPSNVWPLFSEIDVPVDIASKRKPRKISKRTSEIMQLRGQGISFDEIAKRFGISRQAAQSAHKTGTKRNSLKSTSGNNPISRGDGMIKRDDRGNPIKERDVKKESVDNVVENLKKLGMTEDEINILLTGNTNNPSPDFRSSQGLGLRSRNSNSSNPENWPQNEKNTYLDWARARPNFVVPYSIVSKYDRDKNLSSREWNLLKQFFVKYSNNNRGIRSTSRILDISNIGGKRLGQIILGRVKPESIQPDGEKRLVFIVGAPGMGKSTLAKYLESRELIPNENEAAHVDPDYVKQALEGYNKGTGAISVHRESTKAASYIINDAAKQGMDIVTQGTGTRLDEYKASQDPRYRTIVHAAFVTPSIAQQRLDARQKIDGRVVASHILPHIADISYNMMTQYLKDKRIGSFFLWDTDVPEGTAPKLIGKIEDGVFVVNDEEKFKAWSTGGRQSKDGDRNLEYYKRKFK